MEVNMSRSKFIILFLTVFFLFGTCKQCNWKKRTFCRLDEDYKPDRHFINLNKEKRYVVLSDFHRGDGGYVDYFNRNRKIIAAKFKELYENSKKDVVLMLNGDIEEGWAYGHSLRYRKQGIIHIGFIDTNKLIDPYYRDYRGDPEETIFYWEKKFNEQKRYFRIYGNHDDYWANEENLKGTLLKDNDIEVCPGICLNIKDNINKKIFVVHGCQGKFDADVGNFFALYAKQVEIGWWYLLRLVFRKPRERLRPRHIEIAMRNLKKQEEYLLSWAKEKNIVLIAGHSHLPYINGEKYLCLLNREYENSELYRDQLKEEIEKLESKKGAPDSRTVYYMKAFGIKTEEELIKILKVHKGNTETEAEYLNGRKRELEKVKKRKENDQPRYYFNTGCCFAINIITYINIEYKNKNDLINVQKEEGWYIELWAWDIKKDIEILKNDSLKDISGKMSSRLLDSYRIK